ncbi:hypothetical protein HYFRA_00003659 [Hymenoscyphus fraxineus]|uniref:Major facilitator superfamily (MFS) profile domain-containing protein n=1 Tax=Hymenoscyphus fraxineus TaxID=746836 RepID=A0A9N9KYP9_9HELO|nr:hypothetical protein HYFRA_00003659 [Hymenoscyphus fraxineus]
MVSTKTSPAPSAPSSPSITPNNTTTTAHDLEKQITQKEATQRPTSGTRTTSSARVTRTQSLTNRGSYRNQFTHPLSRVKTTEAEIVDFDGEDDPYRPINWPFRKKVVTTLLYGLTTMGSTWASSVYAPGVTQISNEYEVSQEVGLLGISFLLLGFGFGPLLWAPLSEVYGRKPAVLAPYFIAACFSFATATGKDIQTILLTRFFTGLFGSAPVTNTGGVLGDIWSPEQRGMAIVGYAFAVVGGPTLGPIAGGAIVSSYLRWRWTEYITGIMMLFFLFLDLLILDESYPPMLLVFKARRLRHETGNWALHAKHEEWDVSLKELCNKFLLTPFRLLATPICFCVALYASFVYGILYLCLAAIPIQFADGRGWGPVTSELPFLALLGGVILGGGANIYNNKFYMQKFHSNNDTPLPEARLPPMMAGSLSFSAGLFIFGFTSSHNITPVAPLIGLLLMGFGFFTIFQAALNYLIDTFTRYSASAIAANTFLRSIFAASFPLFVKSMFGGLGFGGACAVLGGVSCVLIPVPWVFYVYGGGIRGLGRFSKEVM